MKEKRRSELKITPHFSSPLNALPDIPFDDEEEEEDGLFDDNNDKEGDEIGDNDNDDNDDNDDKEEGVKGEGRREGE